MRNTSASRALGAVALLGLGACDTCGQKDGGATAPDPTEALVARLADAGAPCPAGRACAPSDARAGVFRDAKAAGEAALAKMLVATADGFTPEWDAAYAGLGPEGRAAVDRALAERLEPGKPADGITRAALLLPLAEAPHAARLGARVRELAGLDAPGATLRAPRALAVMLRAFTQKAATEAAALGCGILGRKPLEAAPSEDADPAGRAALAEAALLAIAKAKTGCEHVAALAKDPCAPAMRCKDGAPLTGREATDQTEPLCTAEELGPRVDAELARPAREIVATTSAPPLDGWALAALTLGGKLPDELRLAHERRRYPITQPKGPECDLSLPEGTPCHCDETTLRDHACRASGPRLHVAFCRFSVDEAKKTISGVVAAAPP